MPAPRTGPAADLYQAELQRRRDATNARAVRQFAASGLTNPLVFVPPQVDINAERERLLKRLRSLGRELTAIQREYDLVQAQINQLIPPIFSF
jgi:hypothetical protein